MSCTCFNDDNIKGTLEYLLKNHKCICRARFCAGENGRKFQILNCCIEDVDKYKIDGFLNNSQAQRKCDYLFVWKKKEYIFVEFKGKDIVRAIDQITKTVEWFKYENVFTNVSVMAFIISSAYPSNNGTIRKLKLKFQKEFIRLNAQLIIKNIKSSYDPQVKKIS